MKFVVFLTKFIVTAAIAILFASCRFDGELGPGIEGDGNVTTESRNNDMEFTDIEVSRGLDLEIEQANEKSITVIADKNLQNHIDISIVNKVLIVKTDVNIKNATSKRIVVKIPKINSLQASSAAHIIGKSLIKAQNIGLSSSSAGDINISLEAENVTAESSSGSNMTVKGKTLKLETQTSSGSHIEAGELLANDIIADASSGSTSLVHPLASLKATAGSGSNIRYNNDPKIINRNESSGGSVSKE